MKYTLIAVSAICLGGCQVQQGLDSGKEDDPPASHCITISSDGRQLAMESRGVIRLWDVVRNRTEKSVTIGGFDKYGIRCLAFSPDGKKLAVAGAKGRSEGRLVGWDVEAGKLDKQYEGHVDVVQCVLFSTDGKRLFSCEGSHVKIWDALTGKEIGKLEGHGDTVASISLSGDGKSLASGSFDDKTIIIWDVENDPKKIATMKIKDQVTCLSLSRDGKSLLVNDYGKVAFWDVATRKPIGAFEGLGGVPFSVAFSPNGRLVAAQGRTEIAVWDLSTFRKITSFKHLSVPRGFVFTPDSNDLIWCQENGDIRKETLPRP